MPSESVLRRMLDGPDDVRVRDSRSGCEGVLYRVERGSVVALMGATTFRIRLDHLALVGVEPATTGEESRP